MIGDGRWHKEDCPISLESAKACLTNARLKKSNLEDDKTFITNMWLEDRDGVYDGHYRLIHAVLEKTWPKWTLVTYNWDTDWIIKLKDLSATQAAIKVSEDGEGW